MNVLFTSVGRRVELVRAFRQAFENLQLPGKTIAVDVNPLAPALQIADRPIIVPRLTSPDYIPTLIQICQSEQVDLIIPLIDPDLLMLARCREAIESVGTKVALVSSEAVTITNDKWLTTQFFRQLGFATPNSWLPGQLDPMSATYPLFIKPRHGSGSDHTFKVRNERELLFFSDYVPDPIIQEYLSGPEITNDIICDLEGVVLAVTSRQRIEVRQGEVSKGFTMYNPVITESCVQIARALPAIGPITVQCMMKNDMPHFTEINARFGGGVPLGIAAGVDSPRLLLARIAGLQIEIPPLDAYQVGLHMTRFDDSFFLPEEQCRHVESYHF